MNPLNSPLETGLRILMILTSAFPIRLDLNRLVLLDHALLHSADLDGPASLHPAVTMRASELGMKREAIELGLDVILRSGLAHAGLGARGIEYWAGDRADGFLGLLDAPYAASLQDRASWVVGQFGELSDDQLRETLSTAAGHWAEEFHVALRTTEGAG